MEKSKKGNFAKKQRTDNKEKQEQQEFPKQSTYISHINEEVQNYFRGLQDAFHKLRENQEQTEQEYQEQMEIITERALKEAEEKAPQIIGDATCEKTLENLIPMFSTDQLIKLAKLLKGWYVHLSFRMFGSRGVQKIIEVLKTRMEQEENEESLRGAISEICRELEGSPEENATNPGRGGWGWVELIQNTNATHVVRSLISLLSHTSEKEVDPVIKKRAEKPKWRYDEIVALTEGIVTNVEKMNAISFNSAASPTISLLLNSMLSMERHEKIFGKPKNKEKRATRLRFSIDSLCEKILGGSNVITLLQISRGDKVSISKDEEQKSIVKVTKIVDELAKSPIGSRLLETVIEVSNDYCYMCLFNNYYRSRIATLAFHPLGNHVIQKMLKEPRFEPVTTMMMEKLIPVIPDLIKTRKGLVLSSLIGCSVAMKLNEKQVWKAICTAVLQRNGKAESKKSICENILNVLSGERNDRNMNRRVTMACDILCKLLSLPHKYSHVVANSFTYLGIDTLLEIASDSMGSKALEYIFIHDFPIKTKQSLMDAFIESVGQLSVDKFGSRLLDTMYSRADIKRKEAVTRRLLLLEPTLSKHHLGRLVLRNCKVTQYKQKEDIWRSEMTKTATRWRLFQDILADDETTTGAANEDGGNSSSDEESDNPESAPKSKRKAEQGDKIDVIAEALMGKRKRKEIRKQAKLNKKQQPSDSNNHGNSEEESEKDEEDQEQFKKARKKRIKKRKQH